jgi:hypothetical protein
MCKRGCAVGAVVLAVAVATPAFGAVWLSKTTAHQVAVTVTSQTCRSVGWCVRFEVVPVNRCRRVRNVVYCGIAFVTADRSRCPGVVAVNRTRAGRIDRGMAVPMNCGAGPLPSDPAVPA